MYVFLSQFVFSLLRITLMVITTVLIYFGIGLAFSKLTKQKTIPRTKQDNNSLNLPVKKKAEKLSTENSVGYKTFQKQGGSLNFSKKEYKNLKLKIESETGNQTHLLEMAKDTEFIHGEIRKHLKTHLTEGEIKVIQQVIRRNYMEKHQYTLDQLTDDFLKGELYSLVKKPHHIRKKYEPNYFKKIQKIVQQKTLL